MSATDNASVIILVTGLFADGDVVEAGLESAIDGGQAHRIVLRPEHMDEEDWSDVVKMILSATKVVTI